MPGENGKAAKLTGLVGDVTRRKQADLALLKSEKLAIAGRLSAAIAHEIRDPLDAVVNIVYLLRQESADRQTQEFLDEAAVQLERVSQNARQTLGMSRSSAEPVACSPSSVIAEVLRLLAPKFRLAQVDVTTDYRNEPVFPCLRMELQQVLTNILNNAIDAIDPPGKIRIRVRRSADCRDPNIHGVRIIIADTGSGMPPHVLERIAEPFFTTKETSGTGLGMWLVTELMQRQNGRLSISSSDAPAHHGTVISLFFPVQTILAEEQILRSQVGSH